MQESIECFIENQAFSPYDLAPPPPLSLPPCKLDRQHRKTDKNKLLTGEVGRVGEEPTKPYDGEKAWSSKNYLILSSLSSKAHGSFYLY